MKIFRILSFAAILLGFSACNGDKKECDEETVVVEELGEIKEDWSVTTVQGTVTEIGAETRQITLIGSEGNLVTVTAGEALERFDEIAVGDVITFDHVVYVLAEFRAPTEEEIAEPVVLVVDAVQAPADIAPAGAVGTMIKAVVTIEALNRPFMLATVQGPNGNYMTLPVKDAAFIEKLHIGQVLILTYSEATVVSLTEL